MIVDHDDIKLELALLTECAVDGIANGLFAVIHGDYHRCLEIELLLIEVGCAIVRWVYLSTDSSQVGSGGTLHLYLYLAVARVNVVELLLARGAGVGLLLGVEFLVDMEDAALAAKEQSECIYAGKQVVGVLLCKGAQQ